MSFNPTHPPNRQPSNTGPSANLPPFSTRQSSNLGPSANPPPPPNRQSSNMGPTIDDPVVASGLIKALMNTGRTKGSSATPVPAFSSPTPSRPFQDQVENLNAIGNSFGNPFQSNVSNQGYDSYGPSSQTQGRHGRNLSSVSQKSFQTGGYSSRPASASRFHGNQSQGASQKEEPMSVVTLSKSLYEWLDDLTSMFENSPGVARSIQIKVAQEIRRFAQQFANNQRLLQIEVDESVLEKNALYKDLDDMQTQLETATNDRDRYLHQRDQLQRSLDDTRKKATDKIERIEQQYKQRIDELLKQVAVQDEQLKGKRALWLESHPGSSARRDQMTKLVRDPFESPSASQGIGNDSGYMGDIAKTPYHQSPAPKAFGTNSSAPIGAPRGPRRRGGLPTGPAPRAVVVPEPEVNNQKVYNTHPATPPQMSMALVPYNSDNDRAPEFQEEFTVIFKLCEGFVKTYCNIPNLANDQKIASSNQHLWKYMTDCTYPGARQDSHSHVMAVMNDPRSRQWFAMRMLINYLVKQVMTIDAWYKFNPATDADFEAVKKGLAERGLANEKRQEFIDRSARAVQTIVGSSTYQNFRTSRLTQHTKAVRDLIGPVLNQGVSRAEAGRDLGACVVKGWELGVKLHTSHLTFQIYFPETAAKFNASTMIAKDQPNADPMQLQIKQVRLKLVITPVVTLRDDTGTTIRVKSLHLSTVLTMG